MITVIDDLHCHFCPIHSFIYLVIHSYHQFNPIRLSFQFIQLIILFEPLRPVVLNILFVYLISLSPFVSLIYFHSSLWPTPSIWFFSCLAYPSAFSVSPISPLIHLIHLPLPFNRCFCWTHPSFPFASSIYLLHPFI